ncbi:MAG: hypothetical protein FJ125_07750, partial [Deltaproteobacteria bacterium]|nr:hypothetical protein [Deltaproteobacteria bacterium]
MASLCWLVPTLLAGIAGPGIAPAHAATQPGYNQVGLTGYTGLARGRPTAQGTPGGPLAGLALELRLLRLLGGELAFNLAERAGERDFACLLPSYRLT